MTILKVDSDLEDMRNFPLCFPAGTLKEAFFLDNEILFDNTLSMIHQIFTDGKP
jgi:hypothetical protein